MTVSRSPWTRLAAGIRATVSTICSLAVMGGFGWFLIRLSGWPLPDHWPSHAEWNTFLADPLHGSFLRDLGACTGWLLLLFVVAAVAVEILARLTRHRFPRLRLRLPAPLRALAAGIVGASIIGLITGPAHAKPATSGPAQQPPAATALAAPATVHPAVATTATAARSGTVTFVLRGHRYHVIVHRGDTMSKIARQWLGDPDRWPEICRLNRHRHFATGGTLRDCDLIYPRWDLKLPADAIPPPGATPARITTPKPPAARPPVTDPELPPRQPAPPATPTPSPTTSAATDPDSVINLDTPPPAASSPTSDPTPTITGTPASASRAEHRGADSWLTYALATAVLAVAVLVARRRLLARRGRDRARRGLPQRPLPYIASLARHLVHRRNTQPQPGIPPQPDDDTGYDDAGHDFAQPHTPAEPTAIGLQGPGALAAARAAIIATLSPYGDNLPGHVITTRGALETLLEGHSADIAWTRLHVAETVTDALDQLHAQILHTRRSHEPTATDSGRARILLVAPPPAGEHSARLQALLETSGAQVTAHILGDWPHTLTIAADGTTAAGPRQPILTAADTIDALNLIGEATTGPAAAPPPIPPPEPATDIEPSSANAEPTAARTTAADSTESEKAHLGVLGAIHFGPERPGTRPHLRGKAKELAVYLACRPHGGDVDIICEILYPDSTVSKSLASVQQAVTSLRKVLTHHTTLRGNPILLSGDRYRLNPDLVTVDLWQLHHLTTTASAATDPQTRQDLLERATRLGIEPLAPELDNDWIDAYRVTTTIATVEAHTALADLLTPVDPHRAATLLAAAISADPGNEALYRQRMRLLAQLGQPDGVRATMRELTQVLADLDTRPAPETQQLAVTLLGSHGDVAEHAQRVERTGPPIRKGPVTPTVGRQAATKSVHTS
ncbi:BTAD domain-containing putative transcriptional regulator [Hamadaea sp. NPDC050747]|uniref:BTAD domain-containing putative transcriptional regulator n=1 Tax=Hamadaea sp. NPDC050747 TaxID=3155789 RepID=UPI0034013D3D